LPGYVDYCENVGLARRDGFDLGVVSPTLQNFLDTVLNQRSHLLGDCHLEQVGGDGSGMDQLIFLSG
jgi:hypothetical protein